MEAQGATARWAPPRLRGGPTARADPPGPAVVVHTGRKVATVPLLIYCDESYDAGQNVFAVSGVVGAEEEWAPLVAAWDEELGDEVFHATDWETRYAKHEDPAKHKESLAQFKRLTQLVCKSSVVGFCIGLDVRRYREYKPDAPDYAPYFLCANELFRVCLECAVRLKAADGTTVSLEYTFDRNEQDGAHLSKVYTLVSSGILDALAQASYNPFGKELQFDTRENRRIQVADLVAREGMKEAERVGNYSAHGLRRSLVALQETARFKFPMRDPVSLAQRTYEQEKEWRKGYYKWLHENNRRKPDDTLADNLGNRLEYGRWDLAQQRAKARQGSSAAHAEGQVEAPAKEEPGARSSRDGRAG